VKNKSLETCDGWPQRCLHAVGVSSQSFSSIIWSLLLPLQKLALESLTHHISVQQTLQRTLRFNTIWTFWASASFEKKERIEERSSGRRRKGLRTSVSVETFRSFALRCLALKTRECRGRVTLGDACSFNTWSMDFYTTRGVAPWWSGEIMQL